MSLLSIFGRELSSANLDFTPPLLTSHPSYIGHSIVTFVGQIISPASPSIEGGGTMPSAPAEEPESTTSPKDVRRVIQLLIYVTTMLV